MEKKVTIEEWVGRFRAIGLDDAAMARWHGLFCVSNCGTLA